MHFLPNTYYSDFGLYIATENGNFFHKMWFFTFY